MANNDMLFILTNPPHGTSNGFECLDMVLAMLAFDIPTNLLFLGDGVLQLLACQNPDLICRKHYAPAFASLPLYEIKHIYVDTSALQQREIEYTDLLVKTEQIKPAEIKRLVDSSNHVVRF